MSLLFSLSARDIDLNRLALDSAKQKKTLMVWLHKTDCGYCESMYEFTLQDEKVSAILKSAFDVVDINIYDKDRVTHHEFTGSGHDFAKHVGFNFYPSTLFMNKDAEIVFAAPGYVEERDFLKMLRYIKSEAYREMSYDAFKKKESASE